MLAEDRDFKVSEQSVARMNDALIFNINQTAMPDDILWINGDWCFGVPSNPQRLQELRGRIHCQTCHLVFGNHDDRKLLAPFFATSHERILVAIASDGRYWMGNDEIKHNKDAKNATLINMCHYPELSWDGSGKNAWMLFGHCHGTMNSFISQHLPESKMLDVGVDCHDYKPWSFDEIKTIMDKKKGFSPDHHNPHK